MSKIDINKFRTDFKSGIDIDSLSDDAEANLKKTGINLAAIDSDKDGKIKGPNELRRLFNAVDKFDKTDSTKYFETTVTAGGNPNIPTTSGVLYEILKSEFDRNRTNAQMNPFVKKGIEIGTKTWINAANDLVAEKASEKIEELATVATASLAIESDYEIPKEAQLAHDIAEGVKKSAEYMEYISTYLKISGKLPPDIENVRKGLEKIEKHLGRISQWAETTGDVLNTIQNIGKYRESLTNFDPEKSETINQFVEGALAVRKSAEPLISMLRKKVIGSLENVTKAGARLNFVFNHVDFMLRGSLKMMDDSVKIVNQYVNRHGTDYIKRGGKLEQFDENPAEANLNHELPQLPSEFESAEDLAKRLEDNKKFRDTQKAIIETEAKFSARRREAAEKFNQKVWPGIYKANRSKVIQKYESVIEDMIHSIPSNSSEQTSYRAKLERYQAALDSFKKGYPLQEEMSGLESFEKGIHGISAKEDGRFGVPYVDVHNRALEKYYKENNLDFKSLDKEIHETRKNLR
jgi:hypothetical protein